MLNEWVVYPWELKECLLEVAGKIMSTGLRGEAVAEKLVEAGFKKGDVDRYLLFEDV